MKDLRKFYTMPKRKFVKNADFRNWKKEQNYVANKLIDIESNFLASVLNEKNNSLFESTFNTALMYWQSEINQLRKQNKFRYTIPNSIFLCEKYFKRFNRFETVYTEVEENLPFGFVVLRFRWHIQKILIGPKSKGYSRLIGSMIYKYKRNIYGENINPI